MLKYLLVGTRGSLASVGKPGSSTLASLAGLLGSREQPLAPTNFQVPSDQPLSGQRLFFDRQDHDSGFFLNYKLALIFY